MSDRIRHASGPLLATLCFTATLLLPPRTCASDPATTAALAALMPAGSVTADVLTPDYPRRIEELAVRMDVAARRNPQWFQAYLHLHGSDAPWHPNFGLTREEYAEYLGSARTATWKIRERATLHFERAGATNRWTIRGWGVLTPIDGTVIDLDAMRVDSRTTQLAFVGLSRPERFEGALDWQWFGLWKTAHRNGDPARGGQALDASFALGPLRDGRNAALYWTYRRVNGGRRQDDRFLLVRFPLAR